MRYAIVSDIHANLQAWDAVYQDILQIGVDEIICLGDIVGYGADAARVVDAVCANVHHTVLGNHDAAAAGRLRMQRFNRDSRRIIEWTQDQLNDSQLRYLHDLPLVVGGETFVCAHAEIAEPSKFRYIHQPAEAKFCWDACQEQVIFLGHTHIPSIHMIGSMGAPHYLPPQELRCNREMRYVVNVGSVGQSRDGDLQACYCLYESDKDRIIFRRIPYDLTVYLQSLDDHEIPPHPCMLEGKLTNPQESLHNMEFRPLEEVGKDDAPLQERKVDQGPEDSEEVAGPEKTSESDKKVFVRNRSRHRGRRTRSTKSHGRRPARRKRRSSAVARTQKMGAARGGDKSLKLAISIIVGVVILAGLVLLIILAANSS